jgi:hypothetical protein
MSQNVKQLIKELIEDVLDEMSTSGAAGPYMSKAAFRGHKSKDAVALRSVPGGKVVGKPETDDTTIGEEKELPVVQRSLEEGRYRNFKKDESMRSHSKVCYGIAEAKKMLREVEFLMDIVERLKTEEGVDRGQLWKRTQHDLSEINKRTKTIARRVYRLGRK